MRQLSLLWFLGFSWSSCNESSIRIPYGDLVVSVSFFINGFLHASLYKVKSSHNRMHDPQSEVSDLFKVFPPSAHSF